MRTFLATLLALAACLVLPVALVAGWLGTVVDDTDRYVETVGPLATDSQVVDAVVPAVAQRITSTLDQTLPASFDVDGGLDALVERGVRAVVTSPQFLPAWETANREAHRQLIAQLRSTGATDNVVIDLGPVATSVTDELGRSLDLGVELPTVSAPVTVLQGERVEQARTAYDALDSARFLAPAAWVVLVALSLLLSRRRPGTLVLLGIGSAATLGLLLLVKTFARDRVVSETSAVNEALTGAVWDGVTRSLDTLTYVGLGAAAVAVVVGLVGGAVARRRTA